MLGGRRAKRRRRGPVQRLPFSEQCALVAYPLLTGADGKKTASQQQQRGKAESSRRRGAPPAAAAAASATTASPPHVGTSSLHRLAGRVQQQEEGDGWSAPHRGPPRTSCQPRPEPERVEGAPAHVLPSAAAARLPPRHMQSSLAALIGGPELDPGRLDAAAAAAGAAGAQHCESPVWHRQQQRWASESPQSAASDDGPHGQHQRQDSSPPAAPCPPSSDFTRRNMARLGGEGVAGIFGAPEGAPERAAKMGLMGARGDSASCLVWK